VLSLLPAELYIVELLSQYVTEVYFLSTEYILTRRCLFVSSSRRYCSVWT